MLYNTLLDAHLFLIKFAKSTRPLKLNDLYLAMIDKLAKNFSEIGLFTRNLSENELFHVCFYFLFILFIFPMCGHDLSCY